MQALDTVFTPCDGGDPGKAPKVFDPVSGQLIQAPAAPIPKGTELVGRGNPAFFCTLTGTPNDLKIFYLWNYRTPSEGLNPERFHLMAAVAGIHDKTVKQQAELPDELGGAPSKIYPTLGGPLLSWCCRSKGATSTAGIDPSTLSVRWTSPNYLSLLDQSSVATYDVFTHTVAIRDVGSGSETVLDNTDTMSNNVSLDSGYILRHAGPGDRFGYYSTVAHKFFPDVFAGDTPGIVHTNQGKLLLANKKSLKIIDIANGDVVFELKPEEVAAVDSYQYGSSGDYLYIANSSDSPVIDIRTHQKVSTGWKVRPLDFLGPSWVLLNRRPNSTEDCYDAFSPFSCTNDVRQFVLQKIDNGKYTGPWY